MHKRYIRKKQSSTQEEWLSVWNNIEKFVSNYHIKVITYNAVEKLIRSTTGKKVAYGWSGGKDSIVIQRLCELAGVKKSVLFTTDLEYEDFNIYVKENAPEGLETINAGLDFEWLYNNQENYLFPREQKYVTNYYNIIQRKGLKKYFIENNLDQVIMGVRTKDGNHVPHNIMINKDGYTRNAIIKDWTHEELLAFIKYNNLRLPNIYFYKDGFREGTGPWSKLRRKNNRDIYDCWRYVYQYDKQAVKKASNYFNSAKKYLKEIDQ